MAKKKKKARKAAKVEATKEQKLAWMQKNKAKYSGAREAARAMKAELGSALWIPDIAKFYPENTKKRRKKAKKAAKKAAKKKVAKKGRKKVKKATRKVAKKGGRRKKVTRKGAADAHGWVVAEPGRGRSWQFHYYGTQAEAVEAMDEMLARGKKRIGLFQGMGFKVKKVERVTL